MKSNTSALLEKIPDFDDFVNLTDQIGKLSLEKMLCEKKIREAESDVVLKCTTQPEFFQGGKPPSMSFIESTYKYSGIGGELLPLREELARISSALESAKLRLAVYRDMLEVWRTLSANERASAI